MKPARLILLCLLLAACSASSAGGSGKDTPLPACSYEASNSALYTDTDGALAVGYADFNRDGREDLLIAYVSGTMETTPIQMFLQNSWGKLVADDSLLPSPVPGTVHARKIVIADFNADGIPDAFIADHGYDQPPFPGAQPLLLLSRDGRFEARQITDLPAGFHHAASAADVNGDGAPDIFVTDTNSSAFLLLNDGSGNFALTRQGIPSLRRGYYTAELIDIDDDGYYDLLAGGHEHEGAATRLFWGDSSGTFSADRAATLPADVDYRIVLDFDAEDLDGDGVRELVLTRTAARPFYQGYYFQILAQNNGEFTDVSQRIVPDKAAWEGAASTWVAWVTLRDFNGDGFRDIVVPDKSRPLIYLNDGQGNFSSSQP